MNSIKYKCDCGYEKEYFGDFKTEEINSMCTKCNKKMKEVKNV